MKTILIILFFIPLFCSAQTISQRVTNLEIANINMNKQIKALVKSDSMAASRELISNAAFNSLSVDFAAFKLQYFADMKKVQDTLKKYNKTYFFDTTYNYSPTHTFRIKADTISVKQK